MTEWPLINERTVCLQICLALVGDRTDFQTGPSLGPSETPLERLLIMPWLLFRSQNSLP